MGLFLETFTCAGCGGTSRRFATQDEPAGPRADDAMCPPCGDRRTAEAAARTVASWRTR